VASHQLYELPALRSAEAVEAIMDAVLGEAKKVEEELTDDLAAGKFGARGLRNRVDRCEAAITKLGTYEELLGQNLASIKETFESLRANLVAAVLVAEQE
jgi:hypothetical protein